MRVKIYDADLNYEHEIIERFQTSILSTFETLFSSKAEYETEINALKEELAVQEQKLVTLTELLNTDNSLDRIKQSFEQISSMVLSKNFTSKLDHKAITWLRNLYGDKLYSKINEGTERKKRTRSKSKRKQGDKEVKHLFGEILEIISSIINSAKSPTADISKLEYVKNRVMEELNKTSKGPTGGASFLSDGAGSLATVRINRQKILDDQSVASDISMSELT